MRKQIQQNLEITKKSAIDSLRYAYSNYKNAIIDSLKWSWIDDEGNFVTLEGAEERNNKIKELEKEVLRLRFVVDDIKNSILEKEC